MALLLTPGAVDAADYPIVQKPSLGGERDVYASTTPARLLGFATLTDDADGTPDDAIIEWNFVALPNASPGPIIAVVTNNLRADDNAVVEFAGLSGTFERSGWSRNPTDPEFPAGRAVELDGAFSMPTTSGVATITNAKRGTKIAIIEMPPLTDFKHVGCTNSKQVKLPTRKSKAIACQLQSSRWVKPGMTEIAELTVESLDIGPDDGLAAIAGLNTVAMLVNTAEDLIVKSREFCLDWTPTINDDHGEGESESKRSASGLFSIFAVLPAP